MADRKKVTRTYNVLDSEGNPKELKLTFGPMKLGYIRANKDLLVEVGQKSGFDDLVKQSVILPVSLKAGMGSDAPEDSELDNLEGEDIVDALLSALEASGFVFAGRLGSQGGTSSGEAAPTEA